ncbi:MAG: SURF1 family protein [Hyphomicrobiales bacterium]|nr:SURF1 family protein [Hyphomicrobiales bacterium]
MPAAAVAAAFAVLVGLGVWQLERKSWKDALIAALAERAAVAPVALTEWSSVGPQDAFKRVRLRVTFVPDAREARVYGGAGLREDVKTPGYFAFAPARMADGNVIVINRGHVADLTPDRALKPIALPQGAIEIVGALRWPEPAGWLIRTYSESQDLWLLRDHRAMAQRYGWGEVAPFYIDLESPAPADGVPRPGRLRVTLRNDHLGYALTWFGFAAVLVIAFAVWVRGRPAPRG